MLTVVKNQHLHAESAAPHAQLIPFRLAEQIAKTVLLEPLPLPDLLLAKNAQLAIPVSQVDLAPLGMLSI